MPLRTQPQHLVKTIFSTSTNDTSTYSPYVDLVLVLPSIYMTQNAWPIVRGEAELGIAYSIACGATPASTTEAREARKGMEDNCIELEVSALFYVSCPITSWSFAANTKRYSASTTSSSGNRCRSTGNELEGVEHIRAEDIDASVAGAQATSRGAVDLEI